MVSCLGLLVELSFVTDIRRNIYPANRRAAVPSHRLRRDRPLTPFEIDSLKHGDVEFIRLHGHLVLGQPVNDLRQKMDNLATHGESQFVFNLEDVSRIDSSGVGVLVLIFTSAKEAGGSLKLVNPSRQVKQVLQMCCVLPLFELFSDEQQAVASFSQT
jgi:anti-sigma B factor antagonist